jgi:hypothetical protein
VGDETYDHERALKHWRLFVGIHADRDVDSFSDYEVAEFINDLYQLGEPDVEPTD